ncbi:MAG: FecR domain-containing protein [Acidobacteriota bacterium]|nr:FecR domain-containing protein [Acidobacteriota bacterium]
MLLLLTACLGAAPARFARIGDFEGSAELQIHAADSWRVAQRNTPVLEGSRIRTEDSGRIEIEMDDGSALRLTGGALTEISDYTRLSTGQRISLLSIDHGTVYFTGHPRDHDSLGVAVPGAQVTLRRASRIRFEVGESGSRISVLEGLVRFSTLSAELEIREGQMARVEPGNTSRFSLFREIPELESDDWSRKRDIAEEQSHSARNLPEVRYGAADLDQAGSWLQTDDAGLVWKPKLIEGWAPFQSGEWHWYDELGYTWIAAEPWGWTPYHHGRWLLHPSLGWVWAPGASAVFKPGEVYWMRANGLALWGPLAPEETWTGVGLPRQFAALHSAIARFSPGVREFAPSLEIAKPKDLLASASFTVALPSPPLAAARLDAVRPALRSVGTRLVSFAAPEIEIRGASFEQRAAAVPPAIVSAPPPPARTVIVDRPVYVESEPVEVYYPVPVYSGVVVLNPQNAAPARRNPRTHDKKDAPPAAQTDASPLPHMPKRITPPEAPHPFTPVDVGPAAKPIGGADDPNPSNANEKFRPQ